MKKKLFNYLKLIYIKFCGLIFKIRNDVIFFSSFEGRTYSDNPKAISEKLHELNPDLKIVWRINNPKGNIIPEYVETVSPKDALSYYKLIATCKIFVSNFPFPFYPKRNGQFFLQTNHGDRCFKKVYMDSPFYKSELIAESIDGYCDAITVGSIFAEKLCKTALGYNGLFLRNGTPRCDILLHNSNEMINKIKKELKIFDDEKILLYAPTLRRKNMTDKTDQKIQDVDIIKTLDLLEQRSGQKWRCLLRAHPSIKNLTGFAENDRLQNVSKYEDMADLLLISDMLITDYSSSAGDFALLNRPIILYQSDIEEYLNKDRTFYFEMNDSPFFIAHNQTELNNFIEILDKEKILKNCKDILEFFGTYETGYAAERSAEWIINKMNIK